MREDGIIIKCMVMESIRNRMVANMQDNLPLVKKMALVNIYKHKEMFTMDDGWIVNLLMEK